MWSGYHTSVTSHFRNVPKKRTAWAMGGAGRKRGTLRSSQLKSQYLALSVELCTMIPVPERKRAECLELME